MELNIDEIPIQMEGVNLPVVPSTSSELVDDELLVNGSEESDDEEDESKGKPKRARKEQSKLAVHLKGLMGEANLRYARGDVETAKKMCFEVIRQAPDAYEPYLTLSQMYETTNLKKYKGYLMLASHLAPSNIALICRLAEFNIHEGFIIDAIRCYSKAILKMPKNMLLHKKRIELLSQREENKMLLTAKQTMANNISIKQHELIIQLVMEVAREHFSQKNYIRAIEVLRIPIRRIPKKVTKDVINMLLELLLISERYSECLDILTQFCGFTFDIIVTEENNIIMNSYEFPENLETDLKMKFIVCLVKLRADQLFSALIDKVLIEDDVEVFGDLYLDIVEALMVTGYQQEALKLLVLLIKSRNYSLAAVWLKYAECLASLQMYEQAVEAYFTVMAMAPSHVEVFYPLAMLLLKQNKRKEALDVLSQDLSSNKLDVAVLQEQMKLLEQINDWDSYWKSAELLLSRHCIVLKNHEELSLMLTQRRPAEKVGIIKKMRNFRADPSEIIPDFVSIREPSVEDEYILYRHILQNAMEQKNYVMFQKFTYMGLSSKRFSKYLAEITIIAFYASYLNRDIYHCYNIVRDLVLKHPKNNLCWNLFNIATSTPDDLRHPRFLERYGEFCPIKKLVQANYNISTGNCINALNFFVKDFKQNRSAYSAFMLGVALLQYYLQRQVDRVKKKVIAETITYLFLNYAKIRSKQVEQECFYNLGRMYQQLGIMYLAEHYYKKVLEVKNELLAKHPNILSLKQEAAYNLHIIYKNNGNLVAARMVLYQNIIIE